MLNLREAAFAALLGSAEREVLNPSAPAAPPPAAVIVADYNAALLAVKAASFAADGARVAYAQLRQAPAYAQLRQAAAALQSLDLAALLDDAARTAFWINCYNGLVIDAVIQYGVRESVREQLGGVSFFRRAAYNIGGQRYSLEAIEHGILRANAGNPRLPGAQFSASDPRMAWVQRPLDPRIHFALNCASISCPPIGVYDGPRLEAQLDLATRSFVASDLLFDPASGRLTLSALFSWYEADFGGPSGVIGFVVRHLPKDDPRALAIRARQQVTLAYHAYDWRLNGL